MSIVDQGSDSLACVCKWSNGLRNSSRPWIHIFAGENVCIQVITPMQRSSRFASRHARRMLAESINTGFHTTSAGCDPSARSISATLLDWVSTCRSVPSPYID